MYKQVSHEFDLDRHLMAFLQESAFYAELSRHITKVCTDDIPTMGVAFDKEFDRITLYWNEKFTAGLPSSQVRGVLKHEFSHLVFGHLTGRRKTPHKIWNIATDLAINSLIVDQARENHTDVLPDFALLPGRALKTTGDQKQLPKGAIDLGPVIASMPKLMASEFYFEKLMAEANEQMSAPGFEPADGPGEPGDIVCGPGQDSFDDHDAWDDLSEEQREYVKQKLNGIVEKAVRAADSHSSGWGDIPAEIREQIRASVTNVVNWRQVLRQFVGNLVRGHKSTSIKRINRRYPYVHPGVKRGYVAKLLIARDQSGSVSNEMLEDFFGEMASLTKNVEVDILNFDCYANAKEIFPWRKGQIPERASKRERTGGTDFNAPTEVFNDPKNRGRWDGMLILTDGEAPAPGPCRGKRGWVLAKGCKLYFLSDELQIFVDKDKPLAGAWR
jgi:predicted metal-dependent peptidase